MTDTKALVTGIGGFVGSHLAEHLLGEDVEVHGIVRSAGAARNLEHIGDRIGLSYADLTDTGAVRQIIGEVAPDLIFHLAAQAAVPRSWEDPAGTIVNNVVGQLNVLLGVIESGTEPRILVLGSNEEYGYVSPGELPITESNPLRPVSPYAVSKVAQDMLGYQYHVSHGLHCVRVRPFNHIGPRQSDSFAVAAFAKQIAQAEAGLREPIVRVGNLEPQRDFTDVRDIVRGYFLALLRAQPGEVYNIGSGKAVAIRWILEFLVSQSRISITVEIDPHRFRPADQPVTVCDFSKLRQATGWEPRIALEQTLKETLDYWREAIDKSGSEVER